MDKIDRSRVISNSEVDEVPHDDMVPDDFLNDTYLLPSFY